MGIGVYEYLREQVRGSHEEKNPEDDLVVVLEVLVLALAVLVQEALVLEYVLVVLSVHNYQF